MAAKRDASALNYERRRAFFPQKVKIAEQFTYILWLHHSNSVDDELEFLSVFGCGEEEYLMWKTRV